MSEKHSATSGASLHDQLLEIQANIAEYVPPEKQQVHERAIAQLDAEGLAAGALGAGASLPDFSLNDQNGRVVRSAELRAALGERGKLVIVFFRGRWCPFCVTTLEAWRDALAQAKAAGASVSLVAISPMLERQSAFTADQHHLPFPLLSDAANVVARSFGLAYAVNEEQRALFKQVFINLPQQNGDESWELPIPATYVVDRDGKVIFASADADYRRRAEPAEVLRSCLLGPS